MEIQKYIEEISSLEKSHFHLDIELENIVSKVISNENNVQFQIEDLFQNQNLNGILLSKIEQTLNLIFIKEELETNVCFANTDEVRPEYKQSFRLIDLLDYVYVFAHSAFYKQSHKIIIPTDAEVFWKLVEIKKY